MKLHHHTLKFLSIALLLIVGIWGFLFYLNLKKQLNKSLDQRLINHKIDIIKALEKDRRLLTQTAFWGYTYDVRPLTEKEALIYRDHYRNTILFFQEDKKTIPGRKLTTAFRLDRRYYELAVATSTLETDELEQRMLYAMTGLYLALLVSVIFVQNLLLRQVWKPFYALIKQAEQFRLGNNQAWKTYPTKVSEFQSLNETLQSLIDRVEETYQSQKQFIENAAHELQTPVASSLNRLELLLEQEKLNDDAAVSISRVIHTLERLARLNRSLLLLTKIENKQYQERSEINFKALTDTIIQDFGDLAEHKNIHIQLDQSSASFSYAMNLVERPDSGELHQQPLHQLTHRVG